MKKQISEQALNEQVSALSQEITPERDLWSGIERAIQHAPQQNKNKTKMMPVAWAASVIAAVLVTWLTFTPTVNEPGKVDALTVMTQTFEQQKSTMLVSFGQPKITELPKDMQEQLQQLAGARKSIENALRDDPNNIELVNLLRWTQLQELNLLEQLYTPKWQSI